MENVTTDGTWGPLSTWDIPSNESSLSYSMWPDSSDMWTDATDVPSTVNATTTDDYETTTIECTNDYCIPDVEYWEMVYQHIYPKDYEWGLIAMHSVVFVAGLVGNALVCLAVYRNHAMRTVTNYFIVNLAVADFMVILICLPPTVLWDVTETWFMGTGLCKVILYLQTVSVAVSVLTLTFISIDRWYAICFPLRFNSTTSRAKTAIAVIWFVSLAFDIPELVVLRARGRDWDSVLLTQCESTWSYDSEMVFHGAKSLLLYTLPLLFMSVAYYQIVRVLWRSDTIPGHGSSRSATLSSSANGRAYAASGNCAAPSLTSFASRRSAMGANAATEVQLRSRRKAAKMLVAVVVMFALCYLPVHLLNILRYTMDIPQNDATSVISMLAHWLCYANSAVNPIIYNFMSGKFRREFRRTFGLWCWGGDGARLMPTRGRARRGGRRTPGRPAGASYAGAAAANSTAGYTGRFTETVPLHQTATPTANATHLTAAPIVRIDDVD